MAEINDGGPAFPFEYELGEGLGRTNHTGMSLRDWFAGQALAAMNIEYDGNFSEGDRERKYPEKVAEWHELAAYRVADAMIAAREATHG